MRTDLDRLLLELTPNIIQLLFMVDSSCIFIIFLCRELPGPILFGRIPTNSTLRFMRHHAHKKKAVRDEVTIGYGTIPLRILLVSYRIVQYSKLIG